MAGWLAGLAQAGGGLLLIGLVLWDIFQTVVLPRPAPTRVRIARNLVRLTWPLWRWRALQRTSSIDQEKLLGSYAPATVLILLITWFLLMVLGFGLLLYSLRDGLQPVSDFGSILYYAGTSLLTIGFGDITATHGLARLVSVVAGGLGLGILALGITYLFSLPESDSSGLVYLGSGPDLAAPEIRLTAVVQIGLGWVVVPNGEWTWRRELLGTNSALPTSTVFRLEARAGAPPSGIRLLESYGAKDLRPGLAAFFLEWEAWAAEVLDSHVAYPILPYFRSSHDNVSWVSALGAVLDASALVLTTIEDGPTGEATMVQRVGGHFVEDLSNFFGWRNEPMALVERSEFEAACERLKAAGWRIRDQDRAWQAFAGLRSEYAARLNDMALFWVTPPALWIGDRGAVRHLPQGGGT